MQDTPAVIAGKQRSSIWKAPSERSGGADFFAALVFEDRGAFAEFGGDESRNKKGLEAFLNQLEYVAIDAKGEGGWAQLAEALHRGFRTNHFIVVHHD